MTDLQGHDEGASVNRIETHTAGGYGQAAASILGGQDPDCSPASQHSPAWEYMPMPDSTCPECGRAGPGWALSDVQPMPGKGTSMDAFWGTLVGQAMQRAHMALAQLRGVMGIQLQFGLQRRGGLAGSREVADV